MPELDLDRRIQLERADAELQALDRAVKKIESLGGNELYRKAYRVAAKSLRDMALEIVTDNAAANQINRQITG